MSLVLEYSLSRLTGLVLLAGGEDRGRRKRLPPRNVSKCAQILSAGVDKRQKVCAIRRRVCAMRQQVCVDVSRMRVEKCQLLAGGEDRGRPLRRPTSPVKRLKL